MASGTRCGQPCGLSSHSFTCGPAPDLEIRTPRGSGTTSPRRRRGRPAACRPRPTPRGSGSTGQGLSILHEPPTPTQYTQPSPSSTPTSCTTPPTGLTLHRTTAPAPCPQLLAPSGVLSALQDQQTPSESTQPRMYPTVDGGCPCFMEQAQQILEEDAAPATRPHAGRPPDAYPPIPAPVGAGGAQPP